MTSAVSGGFFATNPTRSVHYSRVLWLAILAYFILAALSYWNSDTAVIAVVGLIVLLTIRQPLAGWALTIFVIPFQNLFNLSDTDYYHVLMPLLLIAVAQAIALAAKHRLYRSPLFLVLLSFTALVWLHELTDGASLREMAHGALILSLGAVYLVSRYFSAQPYGLAAMRTAMIASPLLAALLTALFLYVPLPGLISFHGEITNLRLAGVVHNPNALGKLLMFSLVLLVCNAAFRPKTGRWTLLLAAVLAMPIAATFAKSVMVACVVTLFFALLFLDHIAENKRRYWRFPAAIAMGWITWILIFAPWVEQHAAYQWAEQTKASVCYYIHGDRPKSCPPDTETLAKGAQPLAEDTLRDFRLDGSAEMTQKDGKIEYKKRDSKVMQTGQRDRTWGAGLAVLRDHYLWGIGDSSQWKKYMQQLLGFPFDSPHNVLLEIGGGYGLLGLALYLSAITFFVQNYLSIRRMGLQPDQRAANESIFWCGVAIFIVEMLDVATIFGATMHAIWFWVLAGMQSGIRDSLSDGNTSRDLTPDHPFHPARV